MSHTLVVEGWRLVSIDARDGPQVAIATCERCIMSDFLASSHRCGVCIAGLANPRSVLHSSWARKSSTTIIKTSIPRAFEILPCTLLRLGALRGAWSSGEVKGWACGSATATSAASSARRQESMSATLSSRCPRSAERLLRLTCKWTGVVWAHNIGTYKG